MTVTKGALGGLVLAAATMVVALILPASTALLGLAVLLGLIAGVYVGFAVIDGRWFVFVAESVAALAFLVLSVYVFRSAHPVGLLAAGYFLHGAWDLAHHPGPLVGDRAWYAAACVVYDWAIGAFILLMLP